MHGRFWLGLAAAGIVFGGLALAQTPAMAPEFEVNTYTTGGQGFAAVAPGAAGSFLVTWNRFDQDGDGSGVFTFLEQ